MSFLRNAQLPCARTRSARPILALASLLCLLGVLLGAASAKAAPAKAARPKIARAKAAPAAAVPDAKVQALIAAASKAHPRLFFGAGQESALRARINADPLLKQVYERIAQSSDGMIGLDPVVYRKDGRRLLGRSRECLKRVTYLAFMARMTGDPRYAARAQKEMLAAAAFKDWNPSHFLDVAEMTAALAIGYDWTCNQLDPAARAAIRQAIIDKGLKTSFASRWPVTGTNNWGQVCHGGLTLGALAVMEDEPELAARVIQRAVENLHYPMAAYIPNGTYPEGPGYWGYGTTFNVLLIDALSSALGTDFGISGQPGFMQTADYYLHAHGPTGMAFNYSDGGAGGEVEPAMFWFAAKLKRPDLLWMEQRKLVHSRFLGGRPGDGNSRHLPFLLIWAGPLTGITPPAELSRQGQGETALAMFRTGWDANATYLALKGGSPSASHGHMDIGSFIMEADGVRWAADLGMQDYNSLESRGIGLWDGKQTGQRWSVFRLSNFSHNTLVVDGQLQRVAGFSRITRFAPDGDMPHSILDMSPAYAGQLAQAERGVGLLGGKAVLVQDEIQALNRPADVRWAMETGANVTLAGDRATLTQDGKRLELRVLAPAGARLEIFPSDPPPAPYDARNPGMKMVGFKVKLAPSASQRLVLLLTPGGPAAQFPGIRPLAQW